MLGEKDKIGEYIHWRAKNYRRYGVWLKTSNLKNKETGEVEEKSYFQLAKIYIIKNDKNKAAMFINRAIEVNPKNYDKYVKEPMFLPIKNQIEKQENTEKEVIEQSEKEKTISDYLDNTYDLTKVLNQKESKKGKF